MDYGAIAGSLQGLYGGIKTAMDIADRRKDRELQERRIGLDETKAKREAEQYEMSKPAMEFSRGQILQAQRLSKQNEELQKKLDNLESMTSSDHEYSQNIHELAQGLQSGIPDALDVLNKSGFMQNAIYIPEKDDEGKITGYAVKGETKAGTMFVSPEMLKVYEKSAKSSMDAIREQIDAIREKMDNNQIKISDLTGGKETFAERRQQYGLQLRRLGLEQTNKAIDQQLKKESNDIKRLEVFSKGGKAIADQASKDLSAAGKAKDTESKGDLIESALSSMLEGGLDDKYAKTAAGILSKIEWHTFPHGNSDNRYLIKSVLSPAIGEGLSDDEAESFYKAWMKNPKILLTPTNVRRLLNKEEPLEPETLQATIPATETNPSATTPFARGLQASNESPSPESVQVISNTPNANGEIEVMINGVRGWAKAGR